MASSNKQRVLVTGGGTFLGDSIAATLLATGAEVTLLVRPGTEDRLGPLVARVRWHPADVWNPASLRGRSRGHAAVIHTVGSMHSDPAKGLTHNWLNFVSARNVANMCVGDGVPHMVLMSAVRAPWISSRYLHSKREAEQYTIRVGLRVSIIRAPVAYVRSRRRNPMYQLITLFGYIPPFSWLGVGRIAPMPVDVLARGVARVTLNARSDKLYYYGPELRRLGRVASQDRARTESREANVQRYVHPFELLDEDTPFGWTPPDDDQDTPIRR